MGTFHSRWCQLAVGVHLLVVAVASWQLAGSHATTIYACLGDDLGSEPFRADWTRS